jgi:cytochrome c553
MVGTMIRCAATAFASTITAAAAAHAVDIDARALAAGCASCHQASQVQPPALEGVPRDELLAKLRGFRDGTRNGTLMPQLAKGYTDAQLAAVAAYFASRSPAR